MNKVLNAVELCKELADSNWQWSKEALESWGIDASCLLMAQDRKIKQLQSDNQSFNVFSNSIKDELSGERITEIAEECGIVMNDKLYNFARTLIEALIN